MVSNLTDLSTLGRQASKQAQRKQTTIQKAKSKSIQITLSSILTLTTDASEDAFE